MNKIIPYLILLPFICLSCGRVRPNLPEIDFLAGTVMVNDSPAEIGTTIPHGSSIRTAPGSGCDIMVNKKTILRLKENSDVILYYDGTNGCININSGTVMGVIKRVNPSMGGVFTLKTFTVRDAFFGQKKELRSVMHQAVRIRKTYRGLEIQDASRQYHTDSEMESLARKVGYELNWRTMDNY